MNPVLRPGLTIVALLIAGCRCPGPRSEQPDLLLDIPLGTGSFSSPPHLVAGSMAGALVAAIPGTSQPTLAIFSGDRGSRRQVVLPMRGQATRILTIGQKALVVGRSQIMALGPNGRPDGPARSLPPLPNWAMAHAVSGGRLARVTTSRVGRASQLTVQLCDLRGRHLAQASHGIRGRTSVPVVAGLPGGNFVVAWIAHGQLPTVQSLLVGQQGEAIGGVRTIHSTGPGGTIQGLGAQSGRSHGLLCWQDSSARRWQVHLLPVDGQGRPAKPRIFDAAGGSGLYHPKFPAGGGGRWIAWGHGINWSFAGKTGRGRVTLSSLRGAVAPLQAAAAGSLADFSVAINETGILVLAAVEEDGKFVVRAGLKVDNKM